MPESKEKPKTDRNFLKKNLYLIVGGFFLLSLFYIFSFFVKEDRFTRFDFDMTVRTQDNIPVRFDPYFSWFSLVGSFEITLLIITAFALARRRVFAFFAVFMFGFMHVVELIGKAFLDHPGTPFMFHRYAFDFVFPTGYVQPGGSYPSGHSMRAAFLAVFFILIILRTKISKKIKYPVIGLITGTYLIMAVSRVSLGEHWTTDVIGGSLLGAAFALLSLVLI
jgi:membrane-associated phospholipid phosphatase